MLMRTAGLRDFDRLAEQVFGTTARPAHLPMDAWRSDQEFIVELDMPGVDPSTIEIDVERNVLTVKAERSTLPGHPAEMVAAERPSGVFSRQLVLGDALDLQQLSAECGQGVLTMRIPIAEKAKPRRIHVADRDQPRELRENV